MGRKASVGTYTPHPDPAYRDNVQLVVGRRVDNRALYEARFLVKGRWSNPRSLKTADRLLAAERAKTEYERIAIGLPPSSTRRYTVERVAKVALADLENEVLKTRIIKKQKVIEERIRLIKKHFVKPYGKELLSKVNDNDFLIRLRDGLTTSSGKPLARSTISNINAALQILNRTAHAHGWLKIDDFRSIRRSRENRSGDPRPSFSDAEMKVLRAGVSDEWVNAGHTAVAREHRYILRAMVALICCTGIRPGLEIETLTYGQVDLDARDARGNPVTRIGVRANQGKYRIARSVYVDKADPHWDAEAILREYIRWHKGGKAQYLFARPSDGEFGSYKHAINDMFTAFGVRIDPMTGQGRTLYSFRHYYCSKMLLRPGMSPVFLAKVMGTSAQIIEKHYDHIRDQLDSHLLTGALTGIPAEE